MNRRERASGEKGSMRSRDQPTSSRYEQRGERGVAIGTIKRTASRLSLSLSKVQNDAAAAAVREREREKENGRRRTRG